MQGVLEHKRLTCNISYFNMDITSINSFDKKFVYLSVEDRTCLSVCVKAIQGNVENFRHFAAGTKERKIYYL